MTIDYSELELLGNRGFVFMSDDNKPYLCRKWGNMAWLFYWHPDNHWSLHEEVTQTDLWGFPRNLTEEQQQYYHDKHQEWSEKFMSFLEREGLMPKFADEVAHK